MATPAAPKPKPRTIVYIDGLNLYYGAVRQTPRLKWLDIEKYCRFLRPHDDVRVIRYFSALIAGPTKLNQEAYLKALSTTPRVNVILGRFKEKNVKCGIPGCSNSGTKWFRMPEEKRTDDLVIGPFFCLPV